MITVMSTDDVIMFNLKDYDTEIGLLAICQRIKTNQERKRIELDICGEIVSFSPVSCTVSFEQRHYCGELQQINRMIETL